MDQLLQLKSKTLTNLSVVCGSTIKSTKRDNAIQLMHNLEYHLKLPRKISLISIDIGIKNFSYCKLSNIESMDSKLHLNFNTWKTMDLNVKYPSNYQSPINDTISARQRLGFLNFLVFKDLILHNQPDIILIENQRVKSNNNQVTLPGILLNYVFENLFYTNFELLKNYEDLKCSLLPMNSSRLTNYLINRFLIKSEINSSNSKILRNKYVFNLLDNDMLTIEGMDCKNQDKRSFMKQYNQQADQRIRKLDDLFDSVLYALTFIQYHQNNRYLDHYLKNNLDVNELVHILNNNSVYYLRKIEDIKLTESAEPLGHKFIELPKM